MKVVILAGGRGQRLRPYTDRTPKPMLPLGSKPILAYILNNVKKAGFDEVLLATGFMHDQIERYFGNEYKGIRIHYAVEEKPEGTAGSLVKVKDMLDEDFLVLMGDQLTTIQLHKFYQKHLENDAIASIVLKEHEIPIEYGTALIDGEKITAFEEKPVIKKYINTGIYALNKRIFDYIKVGDDFGKDVFPALLRNNEKIGYCLTDKFWVDIGRVKDYEFYRDLMSVSELYHELR
ncbi:MAG: nucleotidyltransferase family protein [Candidatus Micrarchaeota archaeon]|nr:nucleotidyltransferase family protein [Candidatus Micrarchaeota archaeon]